MVSSERGAAVQFSSYYNYNTMQARPMSNNKQRRRSSSRLFGTTAILVVAILFIVLRLETAVRYSWLIHQQQEQPSLLGAMNTASTASSESSSCNTLFSKTTTSKELQSRMFQSTLNHLTEKVYNHNTTVGPLAAPLLKQLQHLFFHSNAKHRALVNPLSSSISQRLVTILHNRIRDPVHHPPLHIAVFGGSIAFGREGSRFTTGATGDTTTDTTTTTDYGAIMYRGNETQARWSTQLELLFNKVIFQTQGVVVKVTNMAVPGVTTDVASILLKYSLWPDGDNYPGPDLIIASFGFNDVYKFVAKDKLTADDAYDHVFQASQKFIQAAHALNNNNNNNPVGIVMVDDSFLISHLTIRDNLMHSRVLSELSTWYSDVMVVSYTKVVLHAAYSNVAALSNLSRSYASKYTLANVVTTWPLFGGVLPTYHPQVMYHVMMAQLLVTELMKSFKESACDDEMSNDDSENSIIAKNPSVSSKSRQQYFHEFNPAQIPPLDNELFFQQVPQQWQDAEKEQQQSKKKKQQHGNACSFLWIASKVTKIQNGNDVNAIMSTVLLKTNNTLSSWKGEGLPVRPPRPGYVATRANATFTIVVPATKYEITKVTILYLKSYGEKWDNSTCEITFQNSGDGTSSTSTTSTHLLYGYHNSDTSVQYDASFDVPSAIKVGESIVATFTVIGGTTFKITGMLFCAQ